MLYLVVLGIASFWGLYTYLRRPSIHRHGKRLQRPADTLPLFGNAIRFLQPRHVLFDWFIQQQSAFDGDTYEIAVPSLPPGVVINSAENIEFVLKNESQITKGEFFRSRSWDLFGYGIINATGELWRLQRKAGLKFFSGENLATMVEDVLPDVYSKSHATLSTHARTGEVLDLQRLFHDLTTSVVGQMAYDMDFDASSPFSKAFDHASDHIALRFQNPLYPITELFTGQTFRAAVLEVKKFGAKIVNNARRRRGQEAMESLILDTGEPQFGSLIDNLIETLGTPEVVADAAMNFLSAGRDTTAESLTWTFYALLRHPDILEKMRDEIAKLSNTSDIRTTHLQPTSIPYTTAVFYEALRLYPPVPIEIKQCLHPVTLPDGTTVPESGIIVWCIYSLNRSPKLYGADAQSFRPERWLDNQGHFQGRSAFEFPVFNGGPRACLGKKMAEVLAAWVLVGVWREWDFEEPREMQERVSQNSLTLPMKDGLPVIVRRLGGDGLRDVRSEKSESVNVTVGAASAASAPAPASPTTTTSSTALKASVEDEIE